MTVTSVAPVLPVNPYADEARLLLGAPNGITVVRTVLAMSVSAWAFWSGDWIWLLAGYLAYWAGDILDGAVARARRQESVIGAVFDIVCDRACTFLLAGAFMIAYPGAIGPLLLFVIQFGVLDTMLSLAFLLWPGVISPNYFYRADYPIWRWNWSKPAKAVNTAAVIGALLLGHVSGVIWPAYAVALLATVVKVGTAVRLYRILTGRTSARPDR